MNGFRTGRAFVLDDNAEEAGKIMSALSRLGIASFYADGQGIPDTSVTYTKLTGIRLLVLDMVLNPVHANDINMCAEAVVTQIDSLLSQTTGPVVLVCWTNQSIEYTNACYAKYRERFPHMQCNEPIRLVKQDFLDDPDKLVSQIAEELAKHEPITLLYSWEQNIHYAATDTTGVLSELITDYHNLLRQTDPGATWAQAAYRVMATLSIAEGGHRLTKPKSQIDDAIGSLFSCLNPLLIDRMEHRPIPPDLVSDHVKRDLAGALRLEAPRENDNRAAGPQVGKSKLEALIGELWAELVTKMASLLARAKLWHSRPESKNVLPPPLPHEIVSRINAMLLVSSIVGGADVPGTVFWMLDASKNLSAFRSAQRFDINDLIDDTVVRHKGGKYIPFIMEISPACDYAQSKARLSRFIGGVLTPYGQDGIRSGTNYVRVLGPVSVVPKTGDAVGTYVFSFNCHFICSLKPSQLLPEPNIRLRITALGDIATWAANQMTRPGLTIISGN